jgi:hypothetical protein
MSHAEQVERSVTRTFRAALRIGEDYITLEETITLPLEASEEDIEQAVDLGWRIYTMQREAMESQVASVREAHSRATITEIPASERQLNYLAALQNDLNWTEEGLLHYAQEQGITLEHMTKNQASMLIEGLKKIAEERTAYQTPPYQHQAEEPHPHDTPTSPFAPITDRQYQALVKLAQTRRCDLHKETQQRYGLAATDISSKQAGDLISEWQRSHTK